MPFLLAEKALPCVGGRQAGRLPAAKTRGISKGKPRADIRAVYRAAAPLHDPRHVLQLQGGRRQLWRALTQHIGSHRARDHNYLSEPANHFGFTDSLHAHLSPRA